MDIKRIGSQPSAKGPSEWFTGNVRIDPLFQAPILHSFRAPVSPLSRVHELLGTPIPRSDAHCLLDEARHELARHYLLHSSRELNETAYLLGYEDANSFFRAFQHREGTSPGHWRALQKSTSSTMQAQVGAV
jgi:helix-turn-helix protein